VFKSTNGGDSWAEINSRITDLVILVLLIDPRSPNILYAGTAAGGGVFKSINGGESWIQISPYITGVTGLTFDPNNPSTIYAAAWSQGVFKSADGGEMWTNLGLMGEDISAVSIDPENSTTIFAGSYRLGLFKSTDGGASWNLVDAGGATAKVISLTVNPQTPCGLYAGTDNDGIFVGQLTVPKAATLRSPSKNIDTNLPAYIWNAVPLATHYCLWVNDSGTKSGKIKRWYTAKEAGCESGILLCSVKPSIALAPGSAEWWIQTWNEAGYGPWSDPMSFTVPFVSPPGKATLVSPSGTISTATPTYTWSAVSSAAWYYLWVNSNGTPMIQTWYTAAQVACGSGMGTCSVTPNTVLAQGSGQWWIQTWNDVGYGPWSEAMSFAVAGSLPGKATLISPSGNVSTPTPTYIWNAVASATWYQLWVNDSSTGSGKVETWYASFQAGCGSGTGTCSVTPSTALALGSAQWWIQTWNDSGHGPWSDGMSFSVVGALPAKGTPRK
jgi:hypothetical protein